MAVQSTLSMLSTHSAQFERIRFSRLNSNAIELIICLTKAYLCTFFLLSSDLFDFRVVRHSRLHCAKVAKGM